MLRPDLDLFTCSGMYKQLNMNLNNDNVEELGSESVLCIRQVQTYLVPPLVLWRQKLMCGFVSSEKNCLPNLLQS